MLGGKDRPDFEISDPGVLNRLYNPAQLALVACAQLDAVGSDQAIDKFKSAISDLAAHDYYVVAGIAENAENLRKFATVMQDAFRGEGLEKDVQTLMLTVGDQSREFSEMINHGANKCGVDGAIRDRIYSPFQLVPTIKTNAESNYPGGRLVFGGRLDANQATAVVQFLRKVMETPPIHSAAEAFAVKTSVFVARMKVEQ